MPAMQYQYVKKKFSYLDGIHGGVLPIRRFTITGGQQIVEESSPSKTTTTAEECNSSCLKNDKCDAWEFHSDDINKTACLLFANKKESPIDIYQAANNDARFVVGFTQRRAKVLRPVSQSTDQHQQQPIEERILYILHFHHEIVSHAFQAIINQILPSSLTSSSLLMDLVVITPREVSLNVVNGILEDTVGSTAASSLINPFRARSEKSRRGANGYMSLPIARACFPGYKGYLLVNDDAPMRLWDLHPNSNVWFGDRPWGTFSPLQYTQQPQILPRKILRRYPYGMYGWSWYNYDSGSVEERTGQTRSNFDAALHAMNELCQNETGITKEMNTSLVNEFCVDRPQNVLSPYVVNGGKADALYVPGNTLGATMSKAMTLFGEHDVMMEIGYPIIMNVVVPKDNVLEMPLCDGSIVNLRNEFDKDKLQFKPYFQLTRDEGKALDCPVTHPVKFGMNKSIAYWKDIVERYCVQCDWNNEKDTFWKLV